MQALSVLRGVAFHQERVPHTPGLRIRSQLVAAAVLVVALAGCDGGLSPPAENRTGTIQSIIRYEGTWPDPDSVRDVRFVAMRFVPQDTSDFLELNRLAISDRLDYGVSIDTAVVSDVRPGVFLYSGVAVNYAQSIFAWRPIALYEENDGIFEVTPGETAHVNITVDFAVRPPFPPPRP